MNKIQKIISIPYYSLLGWKSAECEVYERRVYLAANLGDGKNVK